MNYPVDVLPPMPPVDPVSTVLFWFVFAAIVIAVSATGMAMLGRWAERR